MNAVALTAILLFTRTSGIYTASRMLFVLDGQPEGAPAQLGQAQPAWVSVRSDFVLVGGRYRLHRDGLARARYGVALLFDSSAPSSYAFTY